MRDAIRKCELATGNTDRVVGLMAIAAWTFLTSRSLASGFRDDDWTFLAHVRSAASQIDLVAPSGHFAFYRPAALFLFGFEHALFGLDAAGYLVVNALLHVANAVLGARVLEQLGLRRRDARAAALLFLVGVGHLGKQVGWACAGGPLASVTAALAAMAAAGALVQGARRGRALVVLVGGIALAPLFHESGALAFAFVGLVLFAGRRAGAIPKRVTLGSTLFGLGFSAVWILLLLALRSAYPAYPNALESWTRAPWLFLRYPGFMLFPVQPQQWFGAPVVHAALGALVIAGVLGSLVRARTEACLRPVALLGVWMLVALLPFAVVPMPGLWLEPRYVYFAALPLCGVLVLGARAVQARFASRAGFAPLVRVALALGLAALVSVQWIYASRRQLLARAAERSGLTAMASAEHTWRRAR